VRARSDTLITLTQPLTMCNLSSDDLPLAARLPHEVILAILKLVTSVRDLKACIMVCKSWCQCGIELLWHKPNVTRFAALAQHLAVLRAPEQTFPYAHFIRRINLSLLHDHIDDATLRTVAQCTRLERLTLSRCGAVTDLGVCTLLSHCHSVVALDLSDCTHLTDISALAIGEFCKRLQGLNLGGCAEIGDRGIATIARKCSQLKRVGCLARFPDERSWASRRSSSAAWSCCPT
jgi:hypothetical protein